MAGADVVVVEVVVTGFVVEVDRVVLVVPLVVVVGEPPPGEPRMRSVIYSKYITHRDSCSPGPDTEVVKLPLSM